MTTVGFESSKCLKLADSDVTSGVLHGDESTNPIAGTDFGLDSIAMFSDCSALNSRGVVCIVSTCT